MVFLVDFLFAEMASIESVRVVVFRMVSEIDVIGEFRSTQNTLDGILHVEEWLNFVFVLFEELPLLIRAFSVLLNFLFVVLWFFFYF